MARKFTGARRPRCRPSSIAGRMAASLETPPMPHAPRFLPLAIAALLGACAAPAVRPPAVADGARARLALLESTDLHSNILGYDYYRLAEDKALGFERMATL